MLAVAFQRKPDDPRPSVNWLNAFGDVLTTVEQVERVRRVIHLQLGGEAKFAEFCIGTVQRRAQEESESVEVRFDPQPETDDYPADNSHAEIVGLSDSNEKVISEIIADSVLELHPARSPGERIR